MQSLPTILRSFLSNLLVAAKLAGMRKLSALTYRYYKIGGRKARNFYRLLSSYILKTMHASFSFVQYTS